MKILSQSEFKVAITNLLLALNLELGTLNLMPV
jgi:hypothetical protein